MTEDYANMKIGYQQIICKKMTKVSEIQASQPKMTPTPGVTCSTVYKHPPNPHRNDPRHSKCSIAKLIPRGCLKLVSSITNTQQSWRCILTPRHIFMVKCGEAVSHQGHEIMKQQGPSRWQAWEPSRTIEKR